MEEKKQSAQSSALLSCRSSRQDVLKCCFTPPLESKGEIRLTLYILTYLSIYIDIYVVYEVHLDIFFSMLENVVEVAWLFFFRFICRLAFLRLYSVWISGVYTLDACMHHTERNVICSTPRKTSSSPFTSSLFFSPPSSLYSFSSFFSVSFFLGHLFSFHSSCFLLFLYLFSSVCFSSSLCSL